MALVGFGAHKRLLLPCQHTSVAGLRAARQIPGCHHASIWGKHPSHIKHLQGRAGSEDNLHPNALASAKKAPHRAVKLPQTALNIFPCLQPLCKSCWQERYTLYHTNLFTPSPPLLSWAGFSARSLLFGLPELWLVAHPQPCLHCTATEKSSLTFPTEQGLILI